jgi:hypothetical protein
MTALDLLADEFIEKVLPKLGPALLDLAKKTLATEPDPLLTAAQGGKVIGLSTTTTRGLMQAGIIRCAPGLTELRAKRSAFLAYGSPSEPK